MLSSPNPRDNCAPEALLDNVHMCVNMCVYIYICIYIYIYICTCILYIGIVRRVRWMEAILHHFGSPNSCNPTGIGYIGGARFPPTTIAIIHTCICI